MNQKFEELKTLLRELFQIDQPDLDFGLYRVLRAKSAEITTFLEKDLLTQVKEVLDGYAEVDKKALRAKLEKVEGDLRGLKADPSTNELVIALKQQLEAEAMDLGQVESEIYNHLIVFFRRYYAEGDFLTRHAPHSQTYAIPYDGSEVALHWANKDQYYIKSTERFSDFAFRLRPYDDANPLRVNFRLTEATEGAHNNAKETAAKTRRFQLAEATFAEIEDGELVINFVYAPHSGQQSKLNEAIEASIVALADADTKFAPWKKELGEKFSYTDGTNSKNSKLRVQLDRYTARNTFDYFIHKNLKDFLHRELNFYIKNEVMQLDNVESETAPRVEQYLSKIRLIRKIAGKIIDFLAQLENFQKKLWLKKKFVVETRYCITMGAIPEALYAAIASNDAQREEWVNLLAVDEIKGDIATTGYSRPLTPAFLKENPTLVLDTRNFDAIFVARLLEEMGGLDEQTDGVLFHSENMQALSLMQHLYRDQVKCVYIDPPYNTGNDGFAYRDGYRHSSWISMMADRVALADMLLNDGGLFLASCDRNEHHRLRLLLEARMGESAFVESFTWIRSDNPSNLSGKTRQKAESVLCFEHGSSPETFRGELLEDQDSQPLYNASNSAGTLRFPPNTVEFGFDSAILQPGEYGKGPIVLDEELTVNNGMNVNSLILTGPFRWSQDNLNHEIALGTTFRVATQKSLQPRFRRSVAQNFKRPDNILLSKKVGVLSNEEARAELHAILPDCGFDYPKPVSLISHLIGFRGGDSSLILDFFAGSGTTAHAVIDRNRADAGGRRFILVEMGDYFATVLLPRIKKVTFTPEWEDGKPKRLATADEAARSPRIVKVIRLESYEDTLNNLDLTRTADQQSLLESVDAAGPNGFREQYLLRYMLEAESQSSPSLLNAQSFTDPAAYQLRVKQAGSDEPQLATVDIIETFNWLIGLKVSKLAAGRSYAASFNGGGTGATTLANWNEDQSGPFWFRYVIGTTPDDKSVLVIWRTLPHADDDSVEDALTLANLVLEAWFATTFTAEQRQAFGAVFVNGPCTLDALRGDGDPWTVCETVQRFHALMFSDDGV